MMRRLRTSAACPCDAVRTRMTGFNLFTQEMQREHNVLRSQNLSDGRKNMQVMSTMWANLTVRRRNIYNERARQRNALMLSDPVKKNNNFNLLMRLFGKEKIMLDAGDETFTALIAKSTMRAMKPNDTRRLRAKLQIKNRSSTRVRQPCNITSAFRRYSNPHMMLFDSFTEMQRSVTPTRQSAFTAISKLVSLSNVTESGEECIVDKFATLTAQEALLFAPISDAEAPFFEVFCATRCGSFDYKHFNILQLFTMFRGIEVEVKHNPTREQLYHCLLSSDRSHDGAYFRARRCLERLETLRSSDCGLYISKRTREVAKVPPAAYGIESSWDDVEVATMLAETRREQSVYDDILVRAALLRSKEKNAQLEMYQIRPEEMQAAVATINARAVRKARTVKVRKQEEDDKSISKEWEETPATLQPGKLARAKPVAPLKEEAEVAVAKLRTRTPSPAKASIHVVARRKSKQVESDLAATPPIPAAARRSVRAAIGSSRKPAQKQRTMTETEATEELTASVNVEEKEGDVTDEVGSAVEAVSCKSTKKKQQQLARVASPSAADRADSLIGAEYSMAEEVDGDAPAAEEEALVAKDEAADDLEALLERDFTEEDAASGESAIAVSSAKANKGKAERRRTARSQLTDPTSMLPAKARVHKLITRHSSAKSKRVVLLPTQPQPSPYIPPSRSVDFTASIRALLGGSL
jgi:hypothetical protein